MRGSRRRRRRREHLWLGAFLVLVVVGIAGLAVGPLSLLRNDVTADESCVLGLLADRTGSSDNQELAEARAAEAHRVLEEWSRCRFAVISEIKERFGQAKVAVVPLSSDSQVWLERVEQQERGLDAAHRKIDEIFLSEAGGRTNFLAALDELMGQVNALPGRGQVHLFAWWDGIESVAPFNMRRELRGEESTVTDLLGRLDHVPDCTNWVMHFVGVNRNVAGGVPSDLARGAHLFWRSFVNLCGGTLQTYSSTLPTLDQ